VIVILKNGTTHEQTTELCKTLEQTGVMVHPVEGHFSTIIGLIGDTTHIDID